MHYFTKKKFLDLLGLNLFLFELFIFINFTSYFKLF